MTHTPGPWNVTKSGTHVAAPPCGDFPNGQIICAIKGGPGSRAQDNARLIAAAPDMLDALREIMRNAATYQRGQIASVASAAIAKASKEGRP